MGPRYRVPMRAAEDRWIPTPGATAAEKCVIAHWAGHKAHGLPSATVGGPILDAFVNHGRWMVQCPGCPSACLASRRDHRFFCPECGNALDGGHWLPVRWPMDWQMIERLLGGRPDRRNRNWHPGETVEALQAENIENGVV